jgi:hypothetical protein
MAYTKPTPADLILRYPAFTGVTEPIRQYWLTDAERYVDTSWSEADYAPALMAYAAHRMTEEKVAGITADAASSALASGLTSWKSGSANLSFSDKAIDQAAVGGLSADRYGREYLELLYRRGVSFGTSSLGVVPCSDYAWWPYA